MSGAFQASAFQNSAFQTDGGAPVAPVRIPGEEHKWLSTEVLLRLRAKRDEEDRQAAIPEAAIEVIAKVKDEDVTQEAMRVAFTAARVAWLESYWSAYQEARREAETALQMQREAQAKVAAAQQLAQMMAAAQARKVARRRSEEEMLMMHLLTQGTLQ